MLLVDNPFEALTFIAGLAVLTNACAVMQNSATIRYNLAIPQWRDFRASLAAHNDLVGGLYADPDKALCLAERRIRLLLAGLNLLYAAVALFGTSSLVGLAGAVLAAQNISAFAVWVVVAIGVAGLLALLVATGLFIAESFCAQALLNLQLRLHPHLAA